MHLCKSLRPLDIGITANGYKFDAPSYSTLKKQWTTHSPILLMDSGALKSKVIFLPQEVGSDLPVTMWYFQPLELFAKSLWDPQVMKDIVCFPQRKYTDCGSCVYDKITSADWFYEAFNNSPTTESGMLRSGCLFVGIGHFDDSSNTDHLMKNSAASFLRNYIKSDTRALSII